MRPSAILVLLASVPGAHAFLGLHSLPARPSLAVVMAGNDVDERTPMKSRPVEGVAPLKKAESPFYCDLLFRDKSLRPPVDSTVGKGRSWDAALQLGVAKQIIEDAAHDKAVTRRLLMSAIYRLEYDTTFRRTPTSEEIGKEVAMLDGVWSLVFTDGETGIDKGKDPHGYIKAGTDIDLVIDATYGTAGFRNRLGPTLSGPFTWDPYPTMSCDFLSGNIRGEDVLPEDRFESICKLSLITLEPTHLAVRYVQGANNGVLLFCRTALDPSAPSRVAAAVKAAKEKQMDRRRVELLLDAEGGEQPGSASRSPDGKVPDELEASNMMIGGYDSFWTYLEEECLTVYVLLGFPAFLKLIHFGGPDYQHKIAIMQDLLQGVWQMLTEGGPPALPPM